MSSITLEDCKELVEEVKDLVDNNYFEITNHKNYLSDGAFRYVFAIDDNYVLKYENDNCGCNLAEASAYEFYRDTPKERFLAKVFDISEDGQFLIMERMKNHVCKELCTTNS